MSNEHSTPALLKVALIGCGKMGVNHIKAILANPRATIVAIADPSLDRAKAQSMLPATARWFDTAAEMLDAARPDVVHIVTPPDSHADLAVLAMQRGAHVYVEKPFTLEASAARRVVGVAQDTGRKICAGHQLLFEHPSRLLAEQLPIIQDVVHIESYFAFRPVRKSRDGRSFMTPIDQLLDILPHPVYTLLNALSTAAPGAVASLEGLQVNALGEVHAQVRCGQVVGALTVTLRGRPVDSYLRVVGVNGSVRADFVRGGITTLPGAGSSAISVLTNPYRESWQIAVGSTKGFAARIRGRNKGYPGLNELFEAFYGSILDGRPSPITTDSIVATVNLCEQVGLALRASDLQRETLAAQALAERERALAPLVAGRGAVLVTGATGLLGRPVVARLRRDGWPVKAVARSVPPASAREAGIAYHGVDLSEPLPPELFEGVAMVVHCAAETAGGKDAHERNTIKATQNLIESAAAAGVKKFLHISSIAVLKTSKEVGGPLSEKTPVDFGNLGRGPYVWAKAESERDVVAAGARLGVDVRVLRPGPLVNFEAFTPPGRLGRELGPVFLAIGPKRGKLSLCDVHTMASVISSAAGDFERLPPVVNMVEPSAPTRAELLDRWLARRPDLGTLWMPAWVLGTLSPLAKLAQRVLRPKATPIDIAAAFASEVYDSSLAEQTIQRART